MKGMQKIKRGMGFSGVCEYLLEDGRGTIIGGNMIGVTPIEIAAEFGQSGKVREDIEKPVWHNSLRLPASEHISPIKWNEIADDYMEKMGFGDLHQRLYVMYDNLEGQHIHIIASRIDLTGKMYLGQNENLKSTQHIAQLEKDHNLIIIQIEPEPDTNMPRQRPPNPCEKGMAERTGEIPPRLQIKAIIDAASAEQPNFAEFVDRLNDAGVSIVPSGKTGVPQGISFEISGQPFKGSGLGKSYAWKQLQDRIDYDSDRDQYMIDDLRTRAVKDSEEKKGELTTRLLPATPADYLRSTELADATGFAINRRVISSIRGVAVQISDLDETPLYQRIETLSQQMEKNDQILYKQLLSQKNMPRKYQFGRSKAKH